MGSRGPAPKRAAERHGHRALDDVPAQVDQPGAVRIPAPLKGWNAQARAWYLSLAKSGQSKFYEPSDWANARFCAGLMTQLFAGDTVNAQLVGQIRGIMTDLLVTEGSRRRAGLEIVRKDTPAAAMTGAGNVTVMGDRRARLTDAS